MSIDSLFARDAPGTPLAARLRPTRLADLVGQEQLTGPEGPVSRILASGQPEPMLLYGPPGCGKTTLARLILAASRDCEHHSLSAAHAGTATLRELFAQARHHRDAGRRTVLFLDEIHRFNRTQQDGLLGAMEDGTICLIGATTENPSFALNAALLSRTRVLELHPLDEAALASLVDRALATLPRGRVELTPDARTHLCRLAAGDARYLLNLLEEMEQVGGQFDTERLYRLARRRPALYDRAGEMHFNQISALHKAIRGGDIDGGLYWLARMLDGGEDAHYLARRLTRIAIEDIGLACPDALPRAIAAWQAFERLGHPEGDLALAQLVVSLASAPKSVTTWRAWKQVRKAARESRHLPPPLFARNAPTAWMHEQGYGRDYLYDPDVEGGISGLDFLPSSLQRSAWYQPGPHETHEAAHLAAWQQAFDARQEQSSSMTSTGQPPRPAGPIAEGVDHILLMVPDLEQAARQFQQAGFQLTPRGTHSPQMGTANHTIMFANGTYLELLTVLQPTPANRLKAARLERGPGAWGIAFKTGDTALAARRLADSQAGPGEVLEFSRPVPTARGEQIASFSTTLFHPETLQPLYGFVCQHHTPDLVWQPGYLAHENQAQGLEHIYWVCADPGQAAGKLTRIAKASASEPPRPDTDSETCVALSHTAPDGSGPHTVHVHFTTPQRFAELHPDSPAEEGATALWIRTPTLPASPGFRPLSAHARARTLEQAGTVLVLFAGPDGS